MRLQVAAGKLTISAYSTGDHAAHLAVTDVVEAEGDLSFVVSGRLLADIVSQLGDGDVSITKDPATTRVRLSAGKARFDLAALPLDAYPALPSSPAIIGSVDAAAFAAAIDQVEAAAGVNLATQTLNGIRVEIADGKITLAATDRYRLATTSVAFSTAGDEPVQYSGTIPHGLLVNAVRSVAKGVERISIGASDAQVSLTAGAFTSVIGLIGGDYIAWRGLLSQAGSDALVIDTESLVGAIRRASTVKNDTDPVVLEVSAGELKVSVPGDSSYEETFAATYSGAAMKLGVNPKFLADGIKRVGDQVRISLSGPTKPLYVTEGDFRYMLMPMRVGS